MESEAQDAAAREADRALVDAVLAGDREAFRGLVDREATTVLAVCRRILGDPTEAEDAAQDSFVTAYRKIGSFRGDGPLGGWLMRIAIREAHHRGRRRVPVSAPLALDTDADPAGEPTDRWSDPAATLERDERDATLHAAIGSLPSQYRDAVRMRYIDDLTYPEIAAATGRSEATVRTHLHRGLSRLRDRLAAEPRT